ncbi:MAG TPA: NAD-dependent epimerase/dehydratase family protein [Terriglobales bacterium]|nr:NAD-dependent epimerase/dehydratase family protein [Terriglobales bacterium]
MRVLVLGGTGFIGSALAKRLLAEGHSVAVFHRGAVGRPCHGFAVGPHPPPLCIHGDRRQLEAFASAFALFAPEVVVDAIAGAAPPARRTLRLFDAMARRVVLLSSMDVYRACGIFHGTEDGNPELGALDESAPLRQRPGLYPVSTLQRMRQLCGWLEEGYDKLGMERVATAWHGLEVVIVRLAPVYGSGDRQRRLLPLWRPMRDRRRAILMPRGWAEWRSPRGYVENMAAGLALAATHPRAAGRIYNLADEGNYSEAEWAQQVAGACAWPGRLVVTAPSHTPPHLRVYANTAQPWLADTNRIRRELGFRERVALAPALAVSLAWEQQQPDTDADRGDYASEDAALRWLGMAAEVGAFGYRSANRANTRATTTSTQTLPSGPTVPPVIQVEP